MESGVSSLSGAFFTSGAASTPPSLQKGGDSH